MPQSIHKGLREGTARQPELSRRGNLIRRAPTDPEAFLLWGAQREREQGKFELSRGRVTCDMIWTSKHQTRVCANILAELLGPLDRDVFAEVLSPPAAIKGSTEKLEEYAAIDSLQTYLISSQDEPHAWLWARQGDGSWPRRPVELQGRDGAIALGGLDIELATTAIFRGIPNAPTVE